MIKTELHAVVLEDAKQALIAEIAQSQVPGERGHLSGTLQDYFKIDGFERWAKWEQSECELVFGPSST